MLQVDKLEIEYNGRNLFAPISFTVNNGKICVLMGSSGCGKTSVINAINGLIPHRGIVNNIKNFTVFQDSNQLFPWFSIRKNLDLVCKTDYNATVEQWGLSHLLDSRPNAVSGGQRQRFTLIRAMHSGADVIFCDEPLSGLDAVTKYNVLIDFKKLVSELSLTCLWVTHDLHESKIIGDNLLLLDTNGIKPISRTISEKKFAALLDN